jgi:hypothetical protein
MKIIVWLIMISCGLDAIRYLAYIGRGEFPIVKSLGYAVSVAIVNAAFFIWALLLILKN